MDFILAWTSLYKTTGDGIVRNIQLSVL